MASDDFPIAVVGLAVRLPGAQSCEEFWKLLMEGKSTVGEFPPDRISDISCLTTPFKDQLMNESKPFMSGSYFKSVDKFDTELFQIDPREALYLEPEQRIFLEVTWELFEDAGYASSIRGSNTGVYVAHTVSKYNHLLSNQPSCYYSAHNSSISSQVSSTHDLKGPTVMVGTGTCHSSSLLAVHLACQGLLSGDCEMAIAGGIVLDLLPLNIKTNQPKCKAYSVSDALASGFAKGEGCAAVLLKPLKSAVADGDSIYGILEATTLCYSTAPNSEVLAPMICRAWKLAGVTPGCLEYVETDSINPVEASAITIAFKMFGFSFSRDSESKIPIGFVKANVGETIVAGILSLIKVLMCFMKNKMPPAPANSTANWQNASTVYVNTSLQPWKPHCDESPRFASVDSIGLYVVVKEYVPQRNQISKSLSVHENQLLALAAATEWSLIQFARKVLQYFELSNERSYRLLKNVCYTINTGRDHSRFKHRAIVYASSWEGMTNVLQSLYDSLTGSTDSTQNSFGYTTGASFKDFECSCDLSVHLGAIAHSFLNEKGIKWKELYSDAQKVPLLPTYAFFEVRCWPTDRGSPSLDTVSKELHQASKEHSRTTLSTAQRRMTVVQQAAVTSTAYIETIAYAHTWKCNGSTTKTIFESLVNRHHIMTSRIELKGDTQTFTVSSDEELLCDPAVEVLDDHIHAEDYLTKSIPKMGVISAPLVQFRHLQTGQTSILVVHIHQVIADEVTLKNISCDLQILMSDAEEHVVKQSGFPYADFVAYESIYHNSSQYDVDEAFWKETFATLPPEASLSILPATESAWNDTHAYEAKHQIHTIPANVMENVSKYCATVGVTEFQYSLACSLLLLQRYLGVNDITLAVPVTTRSNDFLYTDGLFVNTILFRIVVEQTMTVKEHIQMVANCWNTAQNHAQYPLDEVTKRLWTYHGKSYTSFCSVMFDYSTFNGKENELRVLSKHAKCPLAIAIVNDQWKKSYDLQIEWATEILDAGIVSRLSEGIVSAFDKALKVSEEKLKDVDVLPQSEHKLLKSFKLNDEFCLTENSTVCKTFEENVIRHPHLSAIVCGDRSLSYFQLQEMAERIAFGLYQSIGKTNLSNNPIVILMEKNELAVASILGIWKAGGHFLPIATKSQTSLKDVLEQCTPSAVIMNDDSDDVSAVVNSSCLILNIEHLLNCPPGVHALDTAINGESLAYIIRTSGSTGRPKVCKISHTSLATIAYAWKSTYKMDDFSVNVLQWTPLTFDVFIADIVRALVCAPGQLTMCPERFQLDVSYIVSLIKTHKITIADVTPHFGMQIIHNASPGDLDSLQVFILGSDVLHSHVFSTIKSKLKPDQRVMNCYGMTEATIDSSFFEGDNIPPTRTGAIPIGKPLPGVTLHILDSTMLQPCPVGTLGELYISGNVLASGDVNIVELKYLRCSALKTGDAACWLPSGDIELFGRLDSVVKLRGFRISTTEIENNIIKHAREVKQVCVIPLTNSSGVEFLCAFVVPHNPSDKHALECNTICSKLKHHLPYYMLPDIVHVIDHIPLTAHGKINHKLLPSFSVLQREVMSKKDKQTSTVNSPTVATLKTLFSKAMGMLNADHIDSDLTFMEQGGHSLILIQFATLIKQETSYRVEIADIFSYPSINSLADYITNCKSTDKSGELVLSNQNSVVESDDQDDDIEDIAITGMGMRLPGGIESLDALWEALNKGDYLFKELPETRKIDVIKCLPSSMANSFKSMDGCRGAFLEKVDQFDNQFFRIPSGEAKYMLPEQRIFLQVATEALAEGKNLNEVKGTKIGVFVGAPEQTGYAKLNHPNEPISIPGLMPGMIATRVAYQWDLKGPTMLIDTACSSSLVAMKHACDSIRMKECESALVGGVNLKIMLSPSSTGDFGQQDDVLFKEFQSDPDAMGSLVGEGILSLYLEPLSTALKEQKPVYGIVKGVASNCVGRGNGITAPSATSQQKVIKEALTDAGLKATDISFLLAHGTGTKLGDRIELSALSSVFSSEEENHVIPLGSTKSVFGHVDSASGLLGVFKVLASLMTKQIPPTAYFNTYHQQLFNSSFHVPTKTISWDVKPSTRRYAGVSSYGMTGTNCHIIIAEQQNDTLFCPDKEQEREYALLLNGRSLEHVQKQTSLYKSYLSQFSHHVHGNLLPSLCLTVAQRLKVLTEMKIGHFQFRLVIMATSIQQVITAIDSISSVKSTGDLISLSKEQSSIQVCCPGYMETEYHSSATQSFLQDVEIPIKELFHGYHGNIQRIPGVAIAMYSESRHWFDYNSQLPVPVTQTDEGLIDLLHRKLSETRESVRTLPLQPPDDLMETEETFCCAIIVKFFLGTELSGHLHSSKEVTFETAFSLSGIIPRYKKFFYVMIRELLRNCLVISSVKDECIDSFQFQCQDTLNSNPESICTHAVERFPLWADCFRFPLYCSKYLLDVLQGRMNPLSVLFPEGDLNFMYTFDKLGDPLGDVYCNTYMQVIASYAMNLAASGKMVRLLEVGGGVGQITRQLLSKLKGGGNIEYWFTDVGNSYVKQAKMLFNEYSHMMKFCTFDVTKDPPMQGVVDSFDIVVTFNVIHATPSITGALLNLKRCLGDEGTLFIIECAKNETWATLTWGLLDGWWLFQDYHIRPNEPMMEPDVWEKVLSDLGFASVLSFPVDQHERSYVEKFLFVCSAKSLDTSGTTLGVGWWEKQTQSVDSVGTFNVQQTQSGTESTSLDTIYDKLKKIWLELLGVEDIQPGDEFRSLGGESLLAMQMINLVHEQIGHRLKIQDTIDYPTLQALATLIADQINLSDIGVD